MRRSFESREVGERTYSVTVLGEYERLAWGDGGEDFDFILEDGSHIHEHQMISLASLFKYVKSGGYYILEDISVAGRPCCCQRNDQTFEIIQNFIKTNKFESPHITKDEQKYIEDNISDIKIYDDIQNAYFVAIFTKK
jgi:hypothetical protein